MSKKRRRPSSARNTSPSSARNTTPSRHVVSTEEPKASTGETSPVPSASASRPATAATSRLPLVVRIVSFVAAAVLTIVGIIGLTQAVGTQSAAQSQTASAVRGETVRHLLVLMSFDESDAATTTIRDELTGTLGPAGIACDVFYLDARTTDYALDGWEAEVQAQAPADPEPELEGSIAGAAVPQRCLSPAGHTLRAGDISVASMVTSRSVRPAGDRHLWGAAPATALTGTLASDARSDLATRIAAKATSTGSYDAIVCVGDDALAYVLVSQDVFSGLPVAFLAVDDLALATAAHDAGFAAGIVEQGAPVLALSTAAELAPAATRAVVLTDGTLQATGLTAQLTSAASATEAPTPALELDTWDTSTLAADELSARLAALDPAGDVVVILGATQSATGEVATPSDAVHTAAAATGATIVTAGGGVGEGAWASAFIDREQEAADAAALAARLLNGEDPASIATSSATPSCVVYDVQLLDAAHISTETLPANAALANEPTLSWRVLRPMLRPALCLLGAIVCIAIFGLIGFRRTSASRRAIVESNRTLQHRLTHDLLTDLPNRQALEAFGQGKHADRQMRAVVQLDIEDFSDVNDSYGHAFGNEVIREVARRLQALPATFVARTGGDEFILCADHTLTHTDPLLAAVDAAFAEPVAAEGNAVELSMRTGIANRARAEAIAPDELVVRADLACQTAKIEGIRTPVFYDKSMREAMERKLQITTTLKRALVEDGVEIVWQPQVDVATLTVYGYEALCRLKGNPYYPGDFIPVAEMSGLVLPLDREVTRKVVEQLAAWRAEGRTPGVASLNFSAAQLRDEGYADFLAGLLAEHDVPGSLIKVEVTESMFIGNEEVADAFFGRLRDLGITLALDDFGTGYSSLAQMASFPAEFVKLDKSLVDRFMVAGQEGFVDHLCQLVHGLDKRLVVEGVETLEQFEICQRLGCDIIQGYFFSKPVSAAEAIAFDPARVVESARSAAGDKTRNRDWSTYKRDANGRWTKRQ